MLVKQEQLLLADRNASYVELGSTEEADAMVSIVEGLFSDSVCQIVCVREQALSVVSDPFLGL